MLREHVRAAEPVQNMQACTQHVWYGGVVCLSAYLIQCALLRRCTYGRQNHVRVEVDLEADPPFVSFSVDGKPACKERWLHGGKLAWPSISVESGEVRCEVTFHDF